ncbi:hypothetical protein [Streptomyces johnsoniae]|uniref:Secreted protein n=1 Tax=Streptomyces johnsoniae TaxID=3075532 RepID=A0ABU2S273_9ACTN|nr:hypothetical protein [Streptomyces sp. DSM 41886]MDT0443098.1 hypothetical protein [Streptomyces sp. DSM 41886]
MRTRLRTLMVGAAAAAGLALTGAGTGTGVAVAVPVAQDAGSTDFHALDYWQFHDHYPTHEECVAVGEEYLWPNNPTGADDYVCEAKNDGWDLWLIFAT